MLDIYVGRQPIFTDELGLYAYELVYRSGDVATAGVTDPNTVGIIDGESATSQVVMNTFMEMGIDHICGDKPAFLNATRNFLLGQYFVPLPREAVVLEVLESVAVDDELVEAVRTLRKDGYRVALDDFVYAPEWEPLLEVADIVKIDILAHSEAELGEVVRRLRDYDVALLAEKVETEEEFDLCRRLGFRYFQGYYFSKPKVIAGKRVPANRLTSLQLLAELQDPAVDVADLEAILTRDVALSYKLLRYINSGFFALRNSVESIRQALVLLGRQTVRNFAVLVVMAGFDDKPSELTTTSLVRARMCEQIGIRTGQARPEECFTVGLLSVLDALMDMPITDVVAQLPLAQHISSALVDHGGVLGEVLHATIAYEEGHTDQLDSLLLESVPLLEVYLESCAWATDAIDSMREALAS